MVHACINTLYRHIRRHHRLRGPSAQHSATTTAIPNLNATLPSCSGSRARKPSSTVGDATAYSRRTAASARARAPKRKHTIATRPKSAQPPVRPGISRRPTSPARSRRPGVARESAPRSRRTHAALRPLAVASTCSGWTARRK